ncbi:hypothetical protein [Streptomyces nondiastaticus]|uniref:Uncharacterized protein n=1 Tax=Streptomyces nondiastaticus TaxID=3154512 RepID=A0ABW6U7S4_9ACTN
MSDRTREEPPPIPEAPPAADDAPDPTASVDDALQPTADAAPPADEASNPDEGSEVAAPEDAPAPSAPEAGAEAEESAEEEAVPERAEVVEPSTEASADGAPDPTATVDDAPEPSASTDVPERAADAEPPADDAPEPLTDASGAADDAPDPAADGPESAEEEAVPERAEAAESSADASADDAPDPTATADDASEQAAPADETSESADEVRESPEDVSEDDAPDPAASVDDAPEPKTQDAQDLTASAESEAEAPRAAEDEAEQYDNKALRDGPHYQDELDDQLAARGLDASEHDKLRLSRTNELSEAQAREVVGVRDTIKLDEGRMVTKVITPRVKDAYLNNATKLGKYDFNPGKFQGSIARGSDTADLRSMDQLRDGLALDDGGAGWTPVPPGASEAYQLRFPAPHDMHADPSFGAVGDKEWADHVAGMAGLSKGWDLEDPFLGTGYTGGGVPEWTAEATSLPHHAEIWCMHADGTEEAIGFFDKNEGLWNDYD